MFYQNTLASVQALAYYTDLFTANSNMVAAASLSQKYQYDNWQMLAKTQFGILSKQQQLNLDFTKGQDKILKSWENILGGSG